jgi:hypothetical protein
MSQSIDRELQEQMDKLPTEHQRRVVDFARSLASSQSNGGSGHALLRFVGVIEQDDLATIERVIEEDCETVNPDEW